MATAKGTWEPRSVYLYIVCLITLVMVLFSVVNIVRASVELIYPEPQRAMPVIKVPPSPPSEVSPELRQTPEDEGTLPPDGRPLVEKRGRSREQNENPPHSSHPVLLLTTDRL